MGGASCSRAPKVDFIISYLLWFSSLSLIFIASNWNYKECVCVGENPSLEIVIIYAQIPKLLSCS